MRCTRRPVVGCRWKPSAPARVVALTAWRESGAVHTPEAGKSLDSARVVGPPASIVDSGTEVKVNFTSTKSCPFRERMMWQYISLDLQL